MKYLVVLFVFCMIFTSDISAQSQKKIDTYLTTTYSWIYPKVKYESEIMVKIKFSSNGKFLVQNYLMDIERSGKWQKVASNKIKLTFDDNKDVQYYFFSLNADEMYVGQTTYYCYKM